MAGFIRPARPACYLGQKLEGALATPVIRNMQGRIRRDDAHQGHIGQIQPLCYHLGADEHLGIPPGKGGKDVIMRRLSPGGIQIHAQGLNPWKCIQQLLLHLLRANAEVFDIGLPALGAKPEQRGRFAAIVAF